MDALASSSSGIVLHGCTPSASLNNRHGSKRQTNRRFEPAAVWNGWQASRMKASTRSAPVFMADKGAPVTATTGRLSGRIVPSLPLGRSNNVLQRNMRVSATDSSSEVVESKADNPQPPAPLTPPSTAAAASAEEEKDPWWRSKSLIAAATVLGGISATAAVLGTSDGDLGTQLADGFLSSFLLVLFSEIGDKTFFIAMFLALRRPQSAVFAGTFGALAIMTVISVGIGRVFHTLDEVLLLDGGIPFDDYAAVALLIFFGVTTLREAYNLPSDAKGEDEKEEAEEAVEGMTSDGFVNIALATFALVFAAEWGDKSFLATIALAAASSPVGVTAGALGGHGLATGMAVVGGTILSRYISEKALAYMGGSLFLGFAFVTLLELIAKSPLGAV